MVVSAAVVAVVLSAVVSVVVFLEQAAMDKTMHPANITVNNLFFIINLLRFVLGSKS